MVGRTYECRGQVPYLNTTRAVRDGRGLLPAAVAGLSRAATLLTRLEYMGASGFVSALGVAV
jgi:hypothetical protein